MNSPCTYIVLPTFNGGAYLAPQLDSLLAQTHTNWIIWTRDDGSTDNTATILNQYSQNHPDRFVRLQDSVGNLGVKQNISLLLQRVLQHIACQPHTHQAYIALCDQDDVWLPHKLESQIACLEALERAHPHQPCMVHSDLTVVDANLNTIAESMSTYNGLRVEASQLGAQLVSSTVTGCTTLFTPALARLALPVAPQAIMHDWWLSLVASGLGYRQYMPEPLVLYRQHSQNTIGAKAKIQTRTFVWKSGARALWSNLQGLFQATLRFIKRLHSQDHRHIFEANAKQAHAFGKQYAQQLSPYAKFLVSIAKLLQLPWPPMQRVIYHMLRRL